MLIFPVIKVHCGKKKIKISFSHRISNDWTMIPSLLARVMENDGRFGIVVQRSKLRIFTDIRIKVKLQDVQAIHSKLKLTN